MSTDLVSSSRGRWSVLADSILDGHQLTIDEAVSAISAPDEELLALLDAAYRIRRKFFGNRVQLYFLMNAKSGICPEDCGYCSQSKTSQAEIPVYNLLDERKLIDGARVAAERSAKTYCIVISARGPSDREMDTVCDVVPKIKSQFDLKICACLGLLTTEQAQRLKSAGVDRVNHNLNTSDEFYSTICSTHTYQDRMDTLCAVRDAGLEICSGGIVGMGESPQDVARMALALRDVGAHSVPVNFLTSIEGTELEDRNDLDPRYCLKVLAMFRFANPDREIRIAGGREVHLRSLQPLGLYAANSIFVGDYLTTRGQAAEDDYRMIEDLGFVVTRDSEAATVANGHHADAVG